VIDSGNGPALVLVPGVQGRWEMMRPAVDALAESFRVLTFALSGEPGAPPIDPRLGFDNDARRVLAALDSHGIDRAIVCGVSFGGLPAIRFAATRPERTNALILVSVPAPPWQLRTRHRLYSSVPWLFGPLFFLESPFRLRREVAVAVPSRRERGRFVRRQLASLVRAPLSPTRMAERASLIAGTDIAADCARVTAPTLIVTGERDLDRVVSVDGTRRYLDLIRGARHVTLAHTGHLGSITRPHVFATIVRDFAIDVLPDLGATDRSHSRGSGTSDAA